MVFIRMWMRTAAFVLKARRLPKQIMIYQNITIRKYWKWHCRVFKDSKESFIYEYKGKKNHKTKKI